MCDHLRVLSPVHTMFSATVIDYILAPLISLPHKATPDILLFLQTQDKLVLTIVSNAH